MNGIDMTTVKSAFRYIFVCAICAASLTSNSQSAGGESPGPATAAVFQFSTSDSKPIIEFNEVHHILAQRDTTPRLRVYGDGRVYVHFPSYMKKAGDYDLQLSSEELNELLHILAGNGIMDFDATATRQERRQMETMHRLATGTVTHISDATDTIVNIRLDGYQRTANSPPINAFRKQFYWRNLISDSRRFPQSASIVNAARATARLQALCNHPSLQKRQ